MKRRLFSWILSVFPVSTTKLLLLLFYLGAPHLQNEINGCVYTFSEVPVIVKLKWRRFIDRNVNKSTKERKREN